MKVISPSLKVVLYTSKEPVKEKYPVKIRVIYNREVKYYSLGVFANEDKFNTTVEPPVIDYGKKVDNAKIKDQFDKAKKAIDAIIESGKDFSFHLFETQYKQTSGSKLKAADYIDLIVEDIEKEERYSTASTYRDCKSSLEAYKPGIRLNEIDRDFLNSYTRHLHKRLSPGSVGIHLRTLRAVINKGIAKKKLSKEAYPFKGFTGIPSTKSRSKKALTKERMKELYDYWKKLSKSEKYSSRWQSLGLFLFSYFAAGINMEDILRLTTEKNMEEGNLKFVRRKTPQQIEIPLHEVAAAIIADFSTVRDNGFLFPFLDKKLPEKTIRHRKMDLLKVVNADLKAIASELGLPDFRFYSARHSFASVQHNQGTSTSQIGEYLGHTSEATTKNYLASLQAETKKEAFGKLL